jgi:hypothetical protein
VCSNFDSCAILNSQAPKIFCLNNVDFLGNSEVAFFLYTLYNDTRNLWYMNNQMEVLNLCFISFMQLILVLAYPSSLLHVVEYVHKTSVHLVRCLHLQITISQTGPFRVYCSFINQCVWLVSDSFFSFKFLTMLYAGVLLQWCQLF